MARYFLNPILTGLLFYIGISPATGLAERKEISFQMEDGWTIYGTLVLPSSVVSTPVPGVVLLHSPGFDRGTFVAFARLLESKGLASLSIDWRGSGESLRRGDLELSFYSFPPKERRKIYLDVEAAVDFLAAQDGVDAKRIGIVGSRLSANHAVLAGVEDWRVKTLVLLSGRFGDQAYEEIALREDLPVLGLAGKEDKEGFEGTTRIYHASQNEESEILIPERGGYGTTQFSYNEGLDEKVAQWLVDKLKLLGHEKEISFQTQDGWTIHGTLHLPDELEGNVKIPGVVLVHGARHDQSTYHRLAPLLVKKNLAVLRIDWRGRGKSRFKDGLRYGSDEFPELGYDRSKVYVDVKAAIDFLAAQRGVDGDRIGVLGATFSTNQVLLASIGDSRVKTIVIVTCYVLDEEAKRYLASEASPPILFLASDEDYNYRYGSLAQFTAEAHQLSRNKESRLAWYEGMGRGTEMFHTVSTMEPMITEWIAEKLDSAN